MAMKLIFNDEFNGNQLNNDKWRVETLEPDFQGNRAQMSQHQTNNFGIDRDGNVGNNKSVTGKRHAVWYDDHHDKTIKVSDGALRMGGYKSNEDDPTIKASHHPYKHPRSGRTADFRKKIFTSWIDTYAMSYHDGTNRPAREESPNFYFRYGKIVSGVNFESVHTDGFRVSIWGLPAVDPADEETSLNGVTYDSDPKNGLECDVFEYENSPGTEHLLLCKNIGGGAAGVAPVDCRKFGIDITKGDHEISVEWRPDVMIWTVDDIEVHRDSRTVPQVAFYICITREANSSVDIGGGIKSQKPFLQGDPGLYGYSVGTESAETINSDVAVINYLRIYQDSSVPGAWISKFWRDGRGVESVSGNKPKPATPSQKPVASNNNAFNLRVDGNALVWNDVNGEGRYDVKFGDNEYVASVKEARFELPSGAQEGQYFITSTPSNRDFRNSSPVSYPKQDAPVTEPVVLPPEVVPPVTDGTMSKEFVQGEVSRLQSIVANLSDTIDNLSSQL